MRWTRLLKANLLNENSLGEPISDNEQTLQNFWNWFNGSKVVDEQGRPLVVYHGTDSSFDTFNSDKPIWVTPRLEYASLYSSKKEQKVLYAKALNLADMGNINSSMHEEKAKMIYTTLGISEQELFNLWKNVTNCGTTHALINSKEFLSVAREKGFDGFKCYEGRFRTYAVFSPNQIKAISNNTNYNTEDNSIYGSVL